MQNIIARFAEQYGLTRNEAMATIENVFSTVFSRWYLIEVMVFFRNDLQLEAAAYNNINKMFGHRFLAFSMPDGHICFQVKVLEEVARKQAQKAGCIEIAAMAKRDETMRQVLFTIVQQLRLEDGVVDRGLIKDSFFGGHFTVTRKIGKSIKGHYTPFHSEPFGSIAEMEQAKPAILRDIMKVSPYLDNNESQDA